MILNFKQIGEGPAIVILHGLFGMSDNWMSIAKKMSADYCFYLVDLRNHGRSPHSDVINYDVMSNDLRLFLERQNLSDIRLIGHSMGGKVAMNFSKHHSHFLSKLIVVDIAPKKYNSTQFIDFINALLFINLNLFQSRKEIENELLKKLKVHPGIIQFLLKNLFRTENNRFKWRMNLPALKMNIDNILDGLKISNPVMTKTLFMKGSESQYITFNDELIIKEKFPNSRIEEIKNATHWVHSSSPINFENTLRSFLA
ncbi:MAG: alpha/beta fold hydrolase [Calditrichaeota bacterium]|nr:MAG: alpha/beta fold hydrolase [Calditrichota bacterium]MBL1206721.1 alpha/beta fold hydrolase [Calditrichota bacterium]NOG46547.1 alpha/beta fold hydrolase [Calditrichota bacterium]